MKHHESVVRLAALLLAAALSCRATAGFTSLQVELHTTANTSIGPTSVYRVYAKFAAGGDQLITWSGNSMHATTIETVCDAPFFNPGGTTSNKAPTQAQVNTNPNLQWGTFATIGVSIANQGPNGSDATILSPGFPVFIEGSELTTSGAAVFVFPDSPQARADYAADGDPPEELRVLMMQLAVPAGETIAGVIGQVQWRAEGSSMTQSSFDQPLQTIDAQGRCCAPDGSCMLMAEAACGQFGNNTFIGCAACAECLPGCGADIAPSKGNGQVNVDDLLAVINDWGPCLNGSPNDCASDVAPSFGDGMVNIDDLLAVINQWGLCP